jgi:hypothetical protein
MKLITTGLVFGLGYLLGRPDGRRQLVQLRQQMTDLARNPEVKRLQERSWNAAGERTLAAKKILEQKLRKNDGAAEGDAIGENADSPGERGTHKPRFRRRPRPYPDAATTTAFTGTTVAEDSHAVITGIPTPPLAARTPPEPPTG